MGNEPQNAAGGEEAKAGDDAENKDAKEEKAPAEIPNKQEGLFCCRRKGVHKLVINATQFFYIVLVVYFSNKLSMLLSDDPIGMVLGLLGYGLAIYTWFWVMPEILDAYTLSTSIEMMKNRECVNKVIMYQKFEKAKRSFRIYQILKLIRREMIVEFQQSVPDREINMQLKQHIVEAFMLLHNPESKAQKRHQAKTPIIRNDQIFTLIRLCAGAASLSREECYIFMKKIHVQQKVEQRNMARAGARSADYARQGGNNPLAFIQLQNFTQAVEMVMNDVKLDPYILVYKLLIFFYSGNETLSMPELKKFFARFETYFQGNDVQMFLKEVALLLRKNDMVDIKEIASMIKNDVEMFPR